MHLYPLNDLMETGLHTEYYYNGRTKDCCIKELHLPQAICNTTISRGVPNGEDRKNAEEKSTD